MRSMACAVAILFAMVRPTLAQTGMTGTWRVEGGIEPLRQWTMVLRVEGSSLTGAVSRCASPAVLISEGNVDGRSFSFACKSLGSDRTITFTGTMSGDTIVLGWAVRGDLRLPPADEGMFGPSAPSRFTAKRVPDDSLAVFAD